MEEKWIKHYSSSQKILLVGEGDFGFALCLARTFGSANNIVATSLDSQEMLSFKYNQAISNLIELRALGCTIFHMVDAKSMHVDYRIKHECYDRIVFNFPHAGFQYREHNAEQIKLHKEVVKGFFENARWMITIIGEVHVTHKTAYPFSLWDIVTLARDVGLYLFEEVPFTIWDYPGYVNKRGDGSMSGESFRVGACSTFKFKLFTF